MNRSHLTADELERLMWLNGETERLPIVEAAKVDAEDLADSLETAERNHGDLVSAINNIIDDQNIYSLKEMRDRLQTAVELYA